ncbi:MAG: thioesterase [Clostridiales bacterium GWB2_37_7]|nr:MAG: thioesterase [Clostridiales bacterium GWB2_37_7]
MKYKVTGKQENSKSCLVCGMKNDFGLKTSFYELENGEIVSIFKTMNEHQSYPGRLHGGITGAILDETIGRAIMIKDKKVWGVTIELNISYKKPIPLNTELKAIGRITKDTSRIFEGTGELILPNGEIAATAKGRYMKMSIDKISNIEDEDMEWQLVQLKEDPEEIEL